MWDMWDMWDKVMKFQIFYCSHCGTPLGFIPHDGFALICGVASITTTTPITCGACKNQTIWYAPKRQRRKKQRLGIVRQTT